MIRIARLTDYGVALMTRMATEPSGMSVTARDLSGKIGLPLPTVSKLLKMLARGDLLNSQRGAYGGYSLARSPEEITLADLVNALEGPVHLTECSIESECTCGLETNCDTKANWRLINRKIMQALESVTLREMSERIDDAETGVEN
ncbi:MAG: SUF system Fe-S cluster assembly regulator [bacterium]|nr:SUF system Fe-S cluster assembly regulator [bacterium]